jgi:DNA-binding LacI/PurR family transcriptional regulator
VLGASERLNYKPNAIARRFVNQRTTMLGVLVGDLSNPYYAQMAQVAERAAFPRCSVLRRRRRASPSSRSP